MHDSRREGRADRAIVQRSRAAKLPPLALIIAWEAACSPAVAPTVWQVPAHEVVARAPEVEAELVSVVYGEATATIALTLRNGGKGPVELDDRSVLLAFEELEYAPVGAAGPLLIPAGRARSLTLRFALGRPFHGPASLQLHHLRRPRQPDAWLPLLTLPIPGQPPSATASRGTPTPAATP